MVAQSPANFPIFRGHARQRGRGFGAIAQTLGRTAIPIIAANSCTNSWENCNPLYLKIYSPSCEKNCGRFV